MRFRKTKQQRRGGIGKEVLPMLYDRIVGKWCSPGHWHWSMFL